MTENQPEEKRPGFAQKHPMSPEQYKEFHRNAELEWGRDAAASKSAERGTDLMVKNPWSGEVTTNDEFDNYLAEHGHSAVRNVVEVDFAPSRLAINS